MYASRDDANTGYGVDWACVLMYIVLIFMGWLNIYGASYQFDNVTSIFDVSTRAGSQLIWIGTSLILCFTLLKLDSSLFDLLSYYIYIAMIALLILTIFIAPDIKGSKSWIVLGPMRVQPAEFAKFAVALALSKYLSSYNLKLLSVKSLFTIIAIIFIPFILIILQQETGSALVFTAFVLVLYRVGLPGLVLVLGTTAAVLFIVGLKYSEIDLGYFSEGEFVSILIIIVLSSIMMSVYRKNNKAAWIIIAFTSLMLAGPYTLYYFYDIAINWSIIGICLLGFLMIYSIYLAFRKWSAQYMYIVLFAVCSIAYVSSINYLFHEVLQPHQQMRIKVTLGMEEDLRGAGYNVNQSKIAIGSGGITGKGFLNGTQTKLKYVPEQDTDFIFCTVGEEHGFVGSVIVLLLFLALILRLIFLAERQEAIFGLVYGYSVAAILFFHLAINIGMVIDITPVIGIPLPFFSYGGSSLWGFTILLFIFLRIDMSRKKR